MTKLEQAARQVLQHWASSEDLVGAITALREALADQAEQEPVLKRRIGDCLLCGHCADTGKRIYAAPVRSRSNKH